MSRFYKPLTPDFRRKIIESLDSQIRELRTCEQNPFVSLQISSLSATKNLIYRLPDGYPIPMTKE